MAIIVYRTDIEVVAVLARDIQKAQKYAKKNHIPNVHDIYEELIQDPSVDALYFGIITELH